MSECNYIIVVEPEVVTLDVGTPGPPGDPGVGAEPEQSFEFEDEQNVASPIEGLLLDELEIISAQIFLTITRDALRQTHLYLAQFNNDAWELSPVAEIGDVNVTIGLDGGQFTYRSLALGATNNLISWKINSLEG